MFEGFETRTVSGEGAEIFCRIAGDGPPLLLLHGYPQTGAMWAGIAPRLAERFRVVVPDLRGYGQSSAPESKGGEGYAKRIMAADMVRVIGKDIGFTVTGRTQVYTTEPNRPPRSDPFGYDISFHPFRA